jgi:hypothetical protein
LESSRLELRRAGVFLCFDASQPNVDDIYNYFDSKRQHFKIPFICGILGFEEQINALPGRNNISKLIVSRKIIQRGRFLTPIVENLFCKISDKDSDLVLIHSGSICDLADWQDEIKAKFVKVYQYDTENLEPLFEDLQKQWDHELFNFAINDISLCLEDGLIYDYYPDDFEVKIDKAKCIFTRLYNENYANVDFKVYGFNPKVKILLDITLNESPHKTSEIVDICSIQPQDNELSKVLIESSAKEFSELVSAYKAQKISPCPFCGEAHDFSVAFFCDKKRKHRFDFARHIVFSEIESEINNDSQYVIFHQKNNLIYFQVNKRRLSPITPNRFIIVAQKLPPIQVNISSKIEFCEMAQIYAGLFYDQYDTYVLVLR